MKLLEQEFYSVGHVIAVAMRKDMWRAPKKRWEVYLRLSSGSQILLAEGADKGEARRYMKEMAGNIGQATGCSFLVTNGGANLLVMDAVTRIFVDGQENGHVLLVEDVCAATYPVERGSKERCDAAMHKVAGAIINYQMMRGGERHEPGGGDSSPH